MPELPEVEIAGRQLNRWLGGHTLTAVELLDPAVVRTHLSSKPSDGVGDPDAVVAPLIGAVAEKPLRHGKRLAWPIGDRAVLIHLGMSGRFVRGAEAPAYARLALRSANEVVWYVDRRRFGCVSVVPLSEADGHLRKGHGPDALDEPLSGGAMLAAFTGRRAVKVALLDQGILAGVGNIQAVEALFRARIDPRASCSALDRTAYDALAAVLPVVLQETVDGEDRGEIAYMSDGARDNPFQMYQREGEPCPVCSAPIQQLTQSGRSTFFCASCQVIGAATAGPG